VKGIFTSADHRGSRERHEISKGSGVEPPLEIKFGAFLTSKIWLGLRFVPVRWYICILHSEPYRLK